MHVRFLRHEMVSHCEKATQKAETEETEKEVGMMTMDEREGAKGESMKKGWPGVIAYAKKLSFRFPIVAFDWDDLNEFGKVARFNEAFLRHHKNADYIHTDKEGRLMGVSYLSIGGCDSGFMRDGKI